MITVYYTTMMKCTICSTSFVSFSNLRRHAKKVHPEQLEEVAPLKNYRQAAYCNECGKSFCKYSNLVQHVKKFHTSKINSLIAPKAYNYKCELCHKQFSDLKNFKNHKKKNHSIPSITSDLKYYLKCPLCNYKDASKHQLHTHFQFSHDITCNYQYKQFNNLKEVYKWKNLLESESKSLFVNQHGHRQLKSCTKTVYVCHRAGHYRPIGKNIRHLKMQGSNKIDGYCPAEILVTVFKNEGKHEVKYLTTHIGHDTHDLGHLNLTKIERQLLAEKIAAHVLFSHILNDIRDSISNGLERIHLITKKDLFNIEQIYNLNTDAVRHKDDALSIDSWVRELGDSVLFYKPQDCESESSPSLKKENFILIFMNEGQNEMLKKYGNDCICVDGTHALNSYDFELTTILVLDDLREGFPCSFMFSNRTEEEVLCIYFTHIMEKLGQKLKPNVFMSDLASSFYNAWLKVMLPAKFKLFCTWHLDRAWRKNLAKIDSREMQVEVYKGLRTLLQETDKEAFMIMIQNFINYLLSNAQTQSFGNYFKQFYSQNCQSWAYCYRLHAGLNTNMHIERMHRTIKHIYLHGNVVKRLDKALYALMTFVKDKLFERLVILHKGKLSTKINILRSRHKSSEMMDTNNVICIESGWQLPSTSSNEIYTIEEKITNCDCKLLCTSCNVCLHKYVCSCLDSSIKWNMCKHIHLICKFRRPSTVETVELPEVESSDLIINEEEINRSEELKIIESIRQKIPQKTLNETEHIKAEKAKIIEEFIEIINTTVTSLEHLQIAKKAIAPIPATIAAVNGPSVSTLIAKENKIPNNTNIEQQRRMFSTKKKTRNLKPKLCNPNAEEKNVIAFSLLKKY